MGIDPQREGRTKSSLRQVRYQSIHLSVQYQRMECIAVDGMRKGLTGFVFLSSVQGARGLEGVIVTDDGDRGATSPPTPN